MTLAQLVVEARSRVSLACRLSCLRGTSDGASRRKPERGPAVTEAQIHVSQAAAHSSWVKRKASLRPWSSLWGLSSDRTLRRHDYGLNDASRDRRSGDVFRKARCSPKGMTVIAAAVLTLKCQR